MILGAVLPGPLGVRAAMADAVQARRQVGLGVRWSVHRCRGLYYAVEYAMRCGGITVYVRGRRLVCM